MRTANTSENHGGDRGDEFLPEFGAGDSNANIVHQILSCFTILSNKAPFQVKNSLCQLSQGAVWPIPLPTRAFLIRPEFQLDLRLWQWMIFKLGTHYPCPRAVFTGRPKWRPCSQAWTRPVNRCQKMTSVFTGRVGHHQSIEHGPWTRVSFLTPVFTGRGHGVNTARGHG